jgi:hypothetical protein
MVQHLAAATLVEDPAVFTDYLRWLEDTLGHRGVPRGAVLAGLAALQPLVASIAPGPAQLLDSCLEHS